MHVKKKEKKENKLNFEMCLSVIHAFTTPSSAEFLKLLLLQCSCQALPTILLQTVNSAAAQTGITATVLTYGVIKFDARNSKYIYMTAAIKCNL